ncbi:MAG: ribosome recycling factor, partial [Selenomonadales bacterium]|nr:ribosome recycling factor [Selenomonadales bacterium]
MPKSITQEQRPTTALFLRHLTLHRIIDSPVGIMPENNGEVIRLGIPALTEERRKELAKQCSKEAETAKISVRNARR